MVWVNASSKKVNMNKLLKLAKLFTITASNSGNWYAAEMSKKCDQYLEGFITLDELVYTVSELTNFIKAKENIEGKPAPSTPDLSDMVYEGEYEENDEYGPQTLRSKVAKILRLADEFEKFEPFDPEESEAYERAKYLDEIEAPEGLQTNWSEEGTEPASEESKEFLENAFELHNKAKSIMDDFIESVDGNLKISYLTEPLHLSQLASKLNEISNSLSENYDYTDEYSCDLALKGIEEYFKTIDQYLPRFKVLSEELGPYEYSTEYETDKTLDMENLIEDIDIVITELNGILNEFHELKDLRSHE